MTLMKIARRWLSIAAIVIFSDLAVSWAQNQGDAKKLYLANCSSCHGESGKGDGVAARSLPNKPADHTNGSVMNGLTDKWLIDVIAKGGAGVGKSSFMPAWSGVLNDGQIRDLVTYIRTLAVPPYKPDTKAGK